MHKLRVGVLRGGLSDEYDVSLKTGGAVLRNLSEDKYIPLDILIDKDGSWYQDGLPSTPERIFRSLDVAYNALHGTFGEDGKINKILEVFNIPFTGSQTLASAISMNKIMVKNRLKELGIKMPRDIVLRVSEDNDKKILEIFRTFPTPIIVKPINSGSSLGTSIVWGFDSLKNAVSEAFSYSEKVIIEEYIRGREATCGVIDNFRGEDIYTLMPVEIVRQNNSLSYNEKYDINNNLICPASFSLNEKKDIQDLTRKIHKHLGLRHLSRSDFIVSPNGIYFLEVNTLPGLTENCPFPKALEAVGSSIGEFTDHIINQALGARL